MFWLPFIHVSNTLEMAMHTLLKYNITYLILQKNNKSIIKRIG